MKRNRSKGIWLLAAALLSTGLVAADKSPPEESGLPVGQRAPAFTLKDQNQKEVSLEALLKKGPVVLVFYRSAEWCSYCKIQLVQFQRNLKEIEAAGGQIIGISYDSSEVSKSFATSQKLSFPLLSDVGSKTIDAYGLSTKDTKGRYVGVSRHGTFILDQKGVIRARLTVTSYDDRLAVDALVKGLKEAQKPDGGTKP